MVEVQDKFARVRAEMNHCLIERQIEIDLALIGLLSKHHMLLVGSPGTAKSKLCDILMRWMMCNKFSILLTKFTDPSETIGPIKVSGLKMDLYERILDGGICAVEMAFIDEIFKASSAILNTFLKVMNERTYVNGRTNILCPLRMLIAASNEFPSEEEELGALFDRFLIRRIVKPISTDRGLRKLLFAESLEENLSGTITGGELEYASNVAMKLPVTNEAQEAIWQIVKDLKKEGVFPSDRRKRNILPIARASAYLEGDMQVEPWHLEPLQHILWDQPEGQPRVVSDVVMKYANPEAALVNSLIIEIEEIENGVDTKRASSVDESVVKLEEIERKLDSCTSVKADATKQRANDLIQAIHVSHVSRKPLCIE